MPILRVAFHKHHDKKALGPQVVARERLYVPSDVVLVLERPREHFFNVAPPQHQYEHPLEQRVSVEHDHQTEPEPKE